jgi:hypothetical protein
MHAWSAGGNYHTVELMLMDVILYFLLARVRAGVLVSDGDHDSRELLSTCPQLFTVNGTGDIKPAITDKNTYSWFIFCQLAYLT